jgi:hypothetical protein
MSRYSSRLAWALALVATPVVVSPVVASAGQVAPSRSEHFLPASNGIGAIAYDAVSESNNTGYSITQFLQHPYRYPSTETTPTLNFGFSTYPGLRIGGPGSATHAWMNTVAPMVIEYLPGTGIIHVRHVWSGLTVDEYHFTPLDLAGSTYSENASVMAVKVTRTAATPAGTIDAYAIFNNHLGSDPNKTGIPGTDGEQSNYSAGNGAMYEFGNGPATIGYASIGAASHFGMDVDNGANNPYGLLNSGADLTSNSPASAVSGGTEVVTGFENSIGDLAVNASGWAGWVTVLSPPDGADHVGNVQKWIAGRSAQALVNAEVAEWASWITPPPAAANATSAEAAIDAQAQVILRMGQVREPGAPFGQVLAAVAPGAWNIAWVRDMAYSVAGLVASGHTTEAKAALQFQLSSTVGTYQSYVGYPYAISVVRYFGNGTEDSDSNNNGPNIEFDGFGLFLWSLDQYVTATNDTAFLSANWSTIKSKVADVLVNLQEPSGLIAADSSIWEVHWMGQQRHFTYTSLTAANGLCAASHLASLMKDSGDQASYLAAGQKTRDAIVASERAADGTLAQSTEGLAIGSLWLDSATLEAINFGLVDPAGRTAHATLASMLNGLVPQSGRGFMRSDVGDTYSSEEWVFVDLRSARAFELTGDTTTANNTFAWNVAQAADNFGELSELHNPVTAVYDGQSPMVGFGGGAYALRLATRNTPATIACGAYAVEPIADGGAGGGTSDAGSDSGAGGGDGGGSDDAGATGGGSGGGETGGFTGDASLPPLTDGGAGGENGGGGGSGAASGDGSGSSGGCSTSGTGGSGRGGENELPWAGLAMALGALVYRRKSR